MYILYNLILNQ